MAVKQISARKAAENMNKTHHQGKPTVILGDDSMPKWDSMAEAVKAGAARVDEALDFAGEARKGHADIIHGVGVAGFAAIPNWVIKNHGEEHVGGLMRYNCERRAKEYLSHNYTPYEDLLLDAEEQRLVAGLYNFDNDLKIWEEEDRFVLTCLCGGMAGYCRREGFTTQIQNAYPWTWNQTDVPNSYVADIVKWEIIPTEVRGYPVRVIQMGETVKDCDIHYFYKKPELIPTEYFSRIGMKKPQF